MLRLTSLGRLYVRTLVLLDGREAPAVLEREPHHSADVSLLDGREDRAVLGCQLDRGPHHSDDVSHQDGGEDRAVLGREGLAVLGDVLEREPHRGADVSHEREGLAVLGCQVQRESRQGDAASRLDGDPLEHQSRSGDGEEVGSLVDDLGNANNSTLTVKTIKVLVSAMMFFKL